MKSRIVKTAQEIIDQVIMEEQWNRHLREKQGKLAERRVIEQIAWNNHYYYI